MENNRTGYLLLAMLSLALADISAAGQLFPDDLPEAKWLQFAAEGYSKAVTGIIYRGQPQPVTGMPIGALDTGYIDIAPNGTFGFSTLFNDMAPRGGPLQAPLLGLSVGGKTWVLASDRSGIAEKTTVVPILPMAGGVGQLANSSDAGELLTFVDATWMDMGSAWSNGKDGLTAVVKANSPKFMLRPGDVGGCTESTPGGTPTDRVTWIGWKAPSAMTITVAGGVWSNHEGRECAFAIRKNGKDIFGGLIGGQLGEHLIDRAATSAKQESFSLSGIEVQANDIITFNFHSKGDPVYVNFGTLFGTSATINSPTGSWDLTREFDTTKGNPHAPWSYGCGRINLSEDSGVVNIAGVNKAQTIDYWGHYPVVDLQYKTTAPIEVALRAWAPFLPRDIQAMNTPGAVFEVHLKNATTTNQSGTLAFSFPGFKKHQSKNRAIGFPNLACEPKLPQPRIARERLDGGNGGVCVKDENWNVSYALAAIGEKDPRVGGELGLDGNSWAAIDRSLPDFGNNDDGGSSVAVKFALKPGGERTVRYVLSWYAPVWDGNGTPGTGEARPFANKGGTYTHMYASRYEDAKDVASFLICNHASLLRRIIAWQQVLYTAPEIPGWLGDALSNNLMYFPRCSVWAQAKPPIGDWCRSEDGLFAMNESPRGCPQMACLPCDTISGMLPIIYFAPECALSTLRTWKAYLLPTGDLPFCFGVYYDLTGVQGGGYQQVMNGANYMIITDRYWRATGNDSFLREFYDSAKRVTEFSFSTRPTYGLSQIVAMPEPTGPANQLEWFEDRHWYGYVAHPGGMRLAHATMMREWAQRMGDTDFVTKLDDWLVAGANALEQHLWNGRFYDAYNEPETGRRENAFFSAQINGQYFALSAGLPGVFPKDHFDEVLKMMRVACNATKTGMPPLLINNDGTLFQERPGNDAVGASYLTGKCGYTNPQVTKIAMAFMCGGQREFGLGLLQKNLELNFLKWGYTWDGALACSQKADDGERSYGTDYYQNMILWGAPAALAGQDIGGPLQNAGLVNRIIKASLDGQEASATDEGK